MIHMIRNEISLRKACFRSTRRTAHRLRFITDLINMRRSIPLIKMIVSLISLAQVKEGSECLKFTSLPRRDKKISLVIATGSWRGNTLQYTISSLSLRASKWSFSFLRKYKKAKDTARSWQNNNAILCFCNKKPKKSRLCWKRKEKRSTVYAKHSPTIWTLSNACSYQASKSTGTPISW